ncbi:hypothetical protein CLOSTMETH_03744 [[Clostridium] methylpentosum DSM 5476]|uniref:Uncharacterized protein n=1 Tax=[Clostridium] methylpentosum DSM 5476 TaxID=537013 RepID=C0EIP9_9FIRM|nr:hypothetical protein CLOSTMETH_03744 [[Clostridium] methylpentosum DSM 5476]
MPEISFSLCGTTQQARNSLAGRMAKSPAQLPKPILFSGCGG